MSRWSALTSTRLAKRLPPSVDNTLRVAHSAAVSKKPHKVEEAATPYTAKPPVKAALAPAQTGIRYADLAKVRETNAKLIRVHQIVLQKLAR